MKPASLILSIAAVIYAVLLSYPPRMRPDHPTRRCNTRLIRSRTFPNRVFFGDTHLHTSVLDRRRHGRRNPRPGGGVSLRPRGRRSRRAPACPLELRARWISSSSPITPKTSAWRRRSRSPTPSCSRTPGARWSTTWCKSGEGGLKAYDNWMAVMAGTQGSLQGR